MHVALNGYFWNQPRTGSGQYLRHLWMELSDLAAERSAGSDALTLSMLLPPALDDEDVPQSPQARVVRSAAVPLVGGRSANVHKLFWEQVGVARAAASTGADVLHTPYLSAPLAKLLPSVVTAHDMIPWVVPGYKGSPAVRLYLLLAAANVRRADVIMADSLASKRDVIKVLRVSPRRVHTVYLGIEPVPDYTSDQLDDVRRRFGLPRDFAFYIGGFDLRKNVPLLLRAWRAVVAQLEPAWCGAGGERPVLAIGGAVPEPGDVFPDVRAEARLLGLDGQGGTVRFLGRISEEDKSLLMAAARIFLYPSAYEGFGFDPLEAMSAGCPVVSSSGGSLTEIVGDAGLMLPPGDESALRDATVRAWTDNELRAELSRRGREKAALFTWRKTAELTQNLYMYASERKSRKQRE